MALYITLNKSDLLKSQENYFFIKFCQFVLTKKSYRAIPISEKKIKQKLLTRGDRPSQNLLYYDYCFFKLRS